MTREVDIQEVGRSADADDSLALIRGCAPRVHLVSPVDSHRSRQCLQFIAARFNADSAQLCASNTTTSDIRSTGRGQRVRNAHTSWAET